MGIFIGPIGVWIWSVLILLSVISIAGLVIGLFFPTKYSYDYIRYILEYPARVIITLPFLEEMIFRFPLVVLALLSVGGAIFWIAVIMSCSIFTLGHLLNFKKMKANPVIYFGRTGFFAAVCIWLVIQYGSIFSALILHIANNFIGYLCAYWDYRKGDYYLD